MPEFIPSGRTFTVIRDGDFDHGMPVFYSPLIASRISISVNNLQTMKTLFAKGDRVELIKDTPVYFKDAVLRVGKSGEQFTILAIQAGAHRVYLTTF